MFCEKLLRFSEIKTWKRTFKHRGHLVYLTLEFSRKMWVKREIKKNNITEINNTRKAKDVVGKIDKKGREKKGWDREKEKRTEERKEERRKQREKIDNFKKSSHY